MCVCVYVCVCARERERKRERVCTSLNRAFTEPQQSLHSAFTAPYYDSLLPHESVKASSEGRSLRQHTSAYVLSASAYHSICADVYVYVSIRQDTYACLHDAVKAS